MDVAKESEWLKILNKMLVVDEQKRWQFEKILHYLEEK